MPHVINEGQLTTRYKSYLCSSEPRPRQQPASVLNILIFNTNATRSIPDSKAHRFLSYRCILMIRHYYCFESPSVTFNDILDSFSAASPPSSGPISGTM